MKQKSIKINAVLNVIRQMCTIMFPLITFPYVSRVLQSENYGKISFVNSVISYFALLAALGIGNYAIREGAAIRDKKEKLNYFSNQIFTINFLSTIISFILLTITFMLWEKLQSYGILVVVSSLSIIFTTIGVDWIYSINEDYQYITIRSIVFQVISIVCMFVFVKNANDYIKYAMITVFAGGASNIFNFIHSRKYINLRLTKRLELKKHLPSMLVLFCNNIMMTIYVNSDSTLIGIFLNDTEVGKYSVAVKIYTIIKNLIAAIVTVIIPRLSYYSNSNDCENYNRLLNKGLKSIISILFPVVIGLFMISKNVINIIAGNEYTGSYISLKILCISLIFSIIAGFFVGCTLLIFKQEKKILIATIISAIINLGLNFVFIPIWGINGASITTLLAEASICCMSFIYSKTFIKLEKYKRTLVTSGIGSGVIVIVCLIINVFELNYIADTILKIMVSGIAYLLVMLIGKNEVLFEFMNTAKSKIKFLKSTNRNN